LIISIKPVRPGGSWLKDIGSTRPTTVVINYASSSVGYARVRCCGFGGALLGDWRLEREHICNEHETRAHSHITLALIRFAWSRSIVPVSRDWLHADLAARSIMYTHSVLGCTSAGCLAGWLLGARGGMCKPCMLRHYFTVQRGLMHGEDLLRCTARLLSRRPDVAQVGMK
jgi:hypothetical protein